MALTNLQLVLLDNLIYLGIFEKIGNDANKTEQSVSSIVTKLLNGDIDRYWKDELKKDQSDDNPGQCFMKKDEWLQILNAIAADSVLMGMTISNVVDADSDSDRENTNFRAACFSSGDEKVIQQNENKVA